MAKEFIPDIALQDNTSQRLPCIIVVDGSRSMSYKKDGIRPIDSLNEGLKTLENELKQDDTAVQRVQLLVIRCGDEDRVEIVQDWVDALDFSAPEIVAKGRTPLGAAVGEGLKKIREQKQNYMEYGIPYNRPWLFIITDGGPTDRGWKRVADECREAENNDEVMVFPIGTEGANFEKLSLFSNRSPVVLDGLKFKEMFVWLSRSVSIASVAAQGEEVQIEALDWGVTKG